MKDTFRVPLTSSATKRSRDVNSFVEVDEQPVRKSSRKETLEANKAEKVRIDDLGLFQHGLRMIMIDKETPHAAKVATGYDRRTLQRATEINTIETITGPVENINLTKMDRHGGLVQLARKSTSAHSASRCLQPYI